MSYFLHLAGLILIVACVIGGFALFLLFLFALIVKPWIIQTTRWSDRGKSVLWTALLAIPIGLGVRNHHLYSQGDRNTYALLAGDRSVRLTHLTIIGQQKKVVCLDPVVLGYFEECLRSHRPHGDEDEGPHYSYELRLEFNDGSSYSGPSYWSRNDFWTYVDKEAGVGPPTHTILFREPMPEGMKKLLKYLQAGWAEPEIMLLDTE